MKLWFYTLAVAALCAPASALDPGTVKGTFELKGKPVELKYAYAHLHDNAEKLLDRPRELRILVTDREVPPESLRGLIFLPVEQLAMQGGVQGMLFELDPAKPNTCIATVLAKPETEGTTLVRTTYSVEGSKLFKQWSFDRQRVTAEIDRLTEFKPEQPDFTAASFSLQFSAPVLNEPAVTADVKGPAAQSSPQVKTILEAARLMASGNLGGARKLQSMRANQQLDTAIKLQGPEVLKMMKQGGAETKKMAAQVQRVVVRGDRAIAIAGKGGWFTLVKEEGRWKMDL